MTKSREERRKRGSKPDSRWFSSMTVLWFCLHRSTQRWWLRVWSPHSCPRNEPTLLTILVRPAHVWGSRNAKQTITCSHFRYGIVIPTQSTSVEPSLFYSIGHIIPLKNNDIVFGIVMPQSVCLAICLSQSLDVLPDKLFQWGSSNLMYYQR